MAAAQDDQDEVESFHEAESRSLVAVEDQTRVSMLESVIVDTFTTVSALKNAYIQLQSAHSPYNADKLRAADRLVIGELRKLSELKHRLKGNSRTSGKNLSINGGNSENKMVVEELKAKVASYQKHVQKLEKQAVEDKSEMEQLKEQLKAAGLKNDKLERRLKSSSSAPHAQQLNGTTALSAPLFEQVAVGARSQAFAFAKMLIGLMKNAEWDLEAAAGSIQPGVVYSKPIHTRFAFESYVCHRMFNGFENENFYLSGSLSSILDPGKHRHDCFMQFQDMKSVDPLELLAATPDCMFGKFCHKKYLQIVHEKMEESFFGQLQHRNQVLGGEHPTSQFYHKFLELAKSVWLLHRLAFAFNPTAGIFQVRKETSYHPEFMESVVDLVELAGEEDVVHTVSFTVMPGFRLDNAIFKCLVYLNPVD